MKPAQAKRAAKARGHRMGLWYSIGNNTEMAICKDCNMKVYVKFERKPIEGFGEALRENCGGADEVAAKR